MQFNEQQKQVINFKDGNCVVLAGAGSGKSTCLVNRIKNLIDSGVDEKDITTITFTRGSADDLKKKLKKLNIENIRVGTYHSICMNILRKEGYILEKQLNDFEYKKVFKELNGNKTPKWKDIINFISFQKNNMIDVNDDFVYKDSEYSEVELRRYYKAYEKLKRDEGCFDFDDVLLWTYEVLLKSNGKYSCKYLLVDEAQDNNLVQNKMLALLCPSNNIMLIGDFRQSIYSFRGSKPEDFMDFNKLLSNCSVVNLDLNYRSKSNIVNNANKFISKYYGSYKHYADSIPSNEFDGNIEIIDESSSEDEAKIVVDKIEKLLKHGCKPSEICVLYRLNSQSNYVENELKSRKIPYDIAKENSFFKRKEIDIIMCMLRLIKNSSDNEAYSKLYTYRMIPFLSKNTFKEIENLSAKLNISLLNASESIRSSKSYETKAIKEFSDIVNKLTRQYQTGTSLNILVDNIIILLNINDYIVDTYGEEAEIEDRKQSLVNFKKFIRNNTLDTFVKYVYEKNSNQKKNANNVQLMTLHKSKGLEFNNVFLIGVDEGKFPNAKADIYDEARLMYVGVTRAKENLYLSSSMSSIFIEQYQ